MVAAGLPSLPRLLAEVTSYAERMYDYRPLGSLDRPAAAAALTRPADALDVAWAPAALDVALDSAQGYPYLLQATGKHVWDVAVRSPISAEDAHLGVSAARAEVDDGLYRSRWERATPRQRALLRAIATLGGSEQVAVADLARELGRPTSGLSVAREEVLRKGLVYVPQRGFLRFSVPGMHAFVLRQE